MSSGDDRSHAGPASTTLAGPDVLCALRTQAPCIMGILNVTPDSFSDGGTLRTVDEALRRAAEHVDAGASVLDIGGESTRPGAKSVDTQTQLRRIMPVVEAIVAEGYKVALSIDTCDSVVAQAALERGVGLVNDVSGLHDPAMRDVVGRMRAHAIVMHMRGTPETMQKPPCTSYEDLVGEVVSELKVALARACASGIDPSRLWVDPGLGFAKTAAHNWHIVRHLEAFATLGYPLLVGASRKGFLKDVVAGPADARDAATAAVCCAAVMSGAQMVRVHNVAAVRDAVATGYALRQA